MPESLNDRKRWDPFPALLRILEPLRVYLSLLALCLCSQAIFAQLTLVKDFNLMPDGSASGIDARNLVDVNGVLFFSGRSEIGIELWKHDNGNTVLIKDIYPGLYSSNPAYLVNVNGIVYFTASDGENAIALWKSDGTAEGTVKIKNLPGPVGQTPYYLVAAEDLLYFCVRKATDYWDIWRSDGTAEGTFVLHENHFPGDHVSQRLAVIGSTLYFSGLHSASGMELWKSDGTVEGTILVKDIAAGADGSWPYDITPIGNTVFFVASTASYGSELWKSDGTESGTAMVKDIRAGPEDANVSALTNVNGSLFFSANDGSQFSTWKSDGTAAGTIVVNSPGIGSLNAVVGDAIFYIRYDYVTWNYELWKWTEASGAFRIREMNSYVGTSPSELMEFNGLLFFLADEESTDARGGREIWRSDGSFSGTYSITNYYPYREILGSAYPSFLTKVGAEIFFVADDTFHGNELWKTGGTAETTFQLTDLPSATYDGYLSNMTSLNGVFYLSAGDEAYGIEPRRSDGTTEGTGLLIDANPGGRYYSSSPNSFRKVNSKLVFIAKSKLWTTDGTTSGTLPVTSTPAINQVNNLVATDNSVLLTASTATGGFELWRSDFPFTTARRLRDIAVLPDLSNPYNLSVHLGDLYFAADENLQRGLWRMDIATSLVHKIKVFKDVNSIIPGGSVIYFVADDGVHGMELWKSDGTAEGTVMVKDLHEGMTGTPFQSFKNVNDILYFVADDGIHGAELWRTDGTDAGTIILKDIHAGTGDPSIRELTEFNGKLYFSADDGIHGKELWTSDGTSSGTELFVVLVSDSPSGEPCNLLPYNGVLYFTAFDDFTRSLWKTNGRACGTVKVAINHTVIAGGERRNIIADNNLILLEGWTAATGWELFKHDVTTDLPIPEDCKSDQRIVFDPVPEKTYGDPPFQLKAVASSGLSVDFNSSDLTIASISGSTVTVHKPGVVTITATASGDDNYSNTSEQQELVVHKALQTIVFDPVNDLVMGDPSIELTASSDANLPVTFTTTSDNVLIEGKVLQLLAPGRVTVSATQPGDEFYLPATTVIREFCVNPLKPTVTEAVTSEGIVLVSDHPGESEWYFNGDMIEGQSQSVLTVNAAGNYSSRAIVESCVSEVSDDVPFLTTAVETPFMDDLIFYPNPVSNSIVIEFPGEASRRIHILDNLSRACITITTTDRALSIDTRNLSPGPYILYIQEKNSSRFEKLMKL